MNLRTPESNPTRMVALLPAIVLLAVSLFAPADLQAESRTGTLEFAVIGDMPYDASQKQQFANLTKEFGAAKLGFVVHAGDYWSDGKIWKENSKGLPPCGDETYQDRLSMAEKSVHPFIITPGDNDWTDCYRARPRAYDPLERLAKLRRMFFAGDSSLGQHKLKLVRQSQNKNSAKFSENARWTWGGVTFATLHMVGSNNNLGRTPEMDKEYEERNTANLKWLDKTFAAARRNGSRAVMIFAQANPQFETTWTATAQRRYMLGGMGIKPPKEKRQTGFDDFIRALEGHVLDFGKPVAYVHGDTHTFRIDKPLYGSISRRMIENFTRVETFGYPDTHWVRVTIDPEDPNVFRFRPEIVERNRVDH
jgi:hypothetical protein